ncbi:MAG: hypothetical protein KF762_03885 [Acidobacteria bacterium]|nr:hypothetical protein [Acidobacteriota bacterium]
MAINQYRPHLLFLPEDYANTQILNGIHLKVDYARQRQMQILPYCGGKDKVMLAFKREYIDYLRKRPNGHVVLIIDFDSNAKRAEEIMNSVPDDIRDRVFVFGSLDEPEEINLGGLENVGKKLAEDCISETSVTWNHEAFRHNASELARFRETVCEILF